MHCGALKGNLNLHPDEGKFGEFLYFVEILNFSFKYYNVTNNFNTCSVQSSTPYIAMSKTEFHCKSLSTASQFPPSTLRMLFLASSLENIAQRVSFRLTLMSEFPVKFIAIKHEKFKPTRVDSNHHRGDNTKKVSDNDKKGQESMSLINFSRDYVF